MSPFKSITALLLLLLHYGNTKAQAPIMGSTLQYIVFTTAGAISNTGTTHLTGNVGSNSGSISGFGNVNGVMHAGDASTLLCAADLAIVYNQLDTTTATAFPSASLGGVDTLGPGVYAVPVAATLDSNLVLSGGGDSSAVFIFKLESTFATATNVKVILINGAQACNVFWKVEGTLTMAAGTTMRGSVIVNNAAISMGSLDTLEGRVMTINGAITIDGINGYTPLGCGLAALTGPTAPNLASTVCYALFTTSGAMANVGAGTTKIRGDVGSNSTTPTGYVATDVEGTIHTVPDSSTVLAAADVLNIYAYLNALSYDIELLYPAAFGNDLLLTPHTYWLGAATTFTGSVLLDAQGNPDAVFVIKCGGALSTSANANVKLLNGAKASNVFWLVEGAADIDANSVFNGTIVCNNGDFSLQAGARLNGRALVKIGAVSTTADSVFIPSLLRSDSATCYPGIVLPIKLMAFGVNKGNDQSVIVSWAAADETALQHYEIMRSENGTQWTTQKTIAAQKNASGSNYYTEENLVQHSGRYYYRLKFVDIDGKVNYSPSRVITMGQAGMASVAIYPNAARNFINIALTGDAVQNSFELRNLVGKTVLEGVLMAGTINVVNLPALDNGMYFIAVKQDEKVTNQKLMVSQ